METLEKIKRIVTSEDIDLNYSEVIFEVTRFCNMTCPHCLRGDMQKLRIKKEYIDTMLNQIEGINTIIFSGGEPSLAIDLIRYTLDYCIDNNKSVDNFWMATNGINTSKKFFDVIKDWVSFCGKYSDVSGLRVSIDNYHDEIDKKWKFENLQEEINNDINSNFYLELAGAPNDSENLISEGRASENYYCTRKIKHNIFLMDDGRIEGALYISAKGYIISTCDISFNSMDNKQDFIVCHVTENIREKLAEWFNNHPEQIYD